MRIQQQFIVLDASVVKLLDRDDDVTAVIAASFPRRKKKLAHNSSKEGSIAQHEEQDKVRLGRSSSIRRNKVRMEVRLLTTDYTMTPTSFVGGSAL